MLSALLAQQIAGETTEAIGYNVIITDNAGMVIGSGDVARVGTFHEASVDVMQTREPAWHDPEQARALEGVRPGITLPLLIGEDQAVGTVGITGSPRQVRRFGIVVRRQTEILLQESELLRSRLLRERALERLVAEVAQFDPDLVDPAVLHEAAGALGFTIPHSRAVVLLELTASRHPEVLRTVRATYQHAQDIVAIRSATRCVVLADLVARDAGRLEELAQHVADQLSASSGRAVAGISEGAATLEELRDACRDAEDALRIGATIRPPIIQSSGSASCVSRRRSPRCPACNAGASSRVGSDPSRRSRQS